MLKDGDTGGVGNSLNEVANAHPLRFVATITNRAMRRLLGLLATFHFLGQFVLLTQKLLRLLLLNWFLASGRVLPRTKTTNALGAFAQLDFGGWSFAERYRNPI